MKRFLLLMILVPGIPAALISCSRSVLPPERALVTTGEAALRSLVLSHADVEKVLADSFRRPWRVVDYESRELVSQRGFSVSVMARDYYLASDIARVRRGLASSEVVTVYFLFGSSRQLKDVAISKWTDSL